MSTRALIGIQRGNKVQYSYCHHDGYPEWVGKVLVNYYKDEPIITELLSFGDMSVLENTLDRCEFYERDRGERGCHRPEVNIDNYNFNLQSDADYINKLRISLKEASETRYWLELLFE
jgi:hypothetical protein